MANGVQIQTRIAGLSSAGAPPAILRHATTRKNRLPDADDAKAAFKCGEQQPVIPRSR